MLSTLPKADIQRQASREVVGNNRSLLVGDRVEEYFKHAPGLFQDAVFCLLSWQAEVCWLSFIPFLSLFNIDLRGNTGWQGHLQFLLHYPFISFPSSFLFPMMSKQFLGFQKLQQYSLLAMTLYFVHIREDKNCIKKMLVAISYHVIF